MRRPPDQPLPGRRRAFRPLAPGLLFASLVLVLAAAGPRPRGTFFPVARADDDPGVGAWGETGAEYKALGLLPDANGLWGYERDAISTDDGTSVAGAWVWVARREGEPEFAYRVDLVIADGTTHVIVQAISGPTPAAPEAPAAPAAPEAPEAPTADDAPVAEPVHVAGDAFPASSDRGAIVRALVREADAACADWARATTSHVTAGTAAPASEDPLDADRRRWRAIARALESARDAHPKHLGIQRDLALAYSRLLPLVAGTPTASTLAALIPEALGSWQRACGRQKTAEDVRTVTRVYASLYLQTGPHVLALIALANLGDDPEAKRLREAFESLGYASIEFLDPVPISGGVIPCQMKVSHASGEPKVPGVFFDRLTFGLVTGDGSQTLQTCFALSGRLSADGTATRWALYGITAGCRRLLRLYGTSEPDGVLVRDYVKSFVQRSLQAVKTSSSTGTGK